MMCAYDKIYLEKARNALGRMLDIAVYYMHYDIDNFFDMFIASGMARRFEKGDVSLIVGRSGAEMTYEVMDKSGVLSEPIYIEYTVDRSPEYWAGWALTYYQWIRNISFADIVSAVSVSRIVKMYSPYHEMDIRHFVDKMDSLYGAANMETKLKKCRKQVGLSQSQLAEISGVSVRTIQQYEQRQKDINKASVQTLMRMATVLYCDVKDLME